MKAMNAFIATILAGLGGLLELKELLNLIVLLELEVVVLSCWDVEGLKAREECFG
jgi:hypothetical protein